MYEVGIKIQRKRAETETAGTHRAIVGPSVRWGL
jgi:hypothetical protein